ncbi:MAG: hypothetical protein LBU46_07985 [Candidatus Accumulibacter sp.]|nr:hypothetical protein [Accumulibacter sp.]
MYKHLSIFVPSLGNAKYDLLSVGYEITYDAIQHHSHSHDAEKQRLPGPPLRNF